MTVLIFGASGQDGHYLAELLRRKNAELLCVSRSAQTAEIRGSVADWPLVEKLVRVHQPDYILHLAANSTTRHEALFENHETICTGTLNILEAVRLHSPHSKVFLSGSGLQFENPGTPISERTPFAPTSGYAVARIQSTYAGRYFRNLGLKVYVGYFFHHDSPRRGPNHISQLIAQAVRRISRGSGEILEIGDASVRKEWGYAGDIVEGVWTLLQQDRIFEAVIGTGQAHSIADFLEACFQEVGRNWRDHVRLRENFNSEYPCLVSDPSTINSLGWTPKVDLPGLARLMTGSEPLDATRS